METQDEKEVELGYSLIQEERYEEAFKVLQPIAERGSKYACLYLGWLYQTGLGVVQSQEHAEKWYRKVADTGLPSGQHYLGNLLRNLQRFREAVIWYERAAAAGYLPAIYRLGRSYEIGQGTSKDELKAKQYLQEAAAKGHLFAQRDVAVLMLKGRFGYLRMPLGAVNFLSTVVRGAALALKDPESEKLR
ncbi:MAG: sel1 repeat family protein [Rhodocyclales bacterium]|nr:sel1 repeat family protein [Rhodocyclales bacterium]